MIILTEQMILVRGAIACYPLGNEVAKGYSNATVHPSVTSLWILQNQHPSMDFDQTWYILSRYRNMKAYLFSSSDVKGQGHRVKYLGERIRHALRCLCVYLAI